MLVPESARATKQFVLASCRPLHDRLLPTIEPHELHALLIAKRDHGERGRGAKFAANRLHSHLCTFFKWAADPIMQRETGLMVDPMLTVKRPWPVKRKATRRKRLWFNGIAADDLVRGLWRYANEEPASDWAKFIKLMLITGKRTNAIRDMRWEHIDASGYWQPPSRSDSKRNNPILLPKLAQQILGQRQPSGKVLPYMGSAHYLQNCARLRPDVPDDFIWHGLRHLMITKLRELRVPPHIARLLTDHLPADDEHAGYEHADQRDEMLAALELWCARIEHLVTPAAKASRAA